MIIGYDGKRAVSNMTGLGNYSRLVLESVGKTFPEDSLMVYAPKLKRNPRLDPLDTLSNIKWRIPSGSSGPLWRSLGITKLLKKDSVDIFHGLSNELPLNIKDSGVKSVVTIHDVIYRRMPQCYSWFDRHIYDFKYGISCRNADRIIAVSERTKEDVVYYYGIEPERIDVIYQGCDSQFARPVSEEFMSEVSDELSLPDRFIVQVGTIESRKNLELTVKALSALPDDVKLVAVGRGREGYKGKVEKLSEELGVKNRIIFKEGLPFSYLPVLYHKALAACYPSRYEGFGIPVIEALSCGCPTIGATGSCLEEAGGPGAIYVNPDDARKLAEVLNAIVDGSFDTARHIAEGREYVKRFDNSSMADRIMAVYEKTLSHETRVKG